jgi:hypothetical protein
MCENALERSLAAVRTMRRRKEGQLIAIGDTRNDYNFDIVRNPNTKRILNMVRAAQAHNDLTLHDST